jgi:GT2 family glycosyltransferase
MNHPNAPLVSAIVRSMDRESLSQALQSLADQQHPNLEIVVVNAKGPGHRELPPQIGTRALRLVGTGAPLDRTRAANVGLDAAQGDLVFFLDDDDIVYPEHVDTLVQALAANPTVRCAYAGVRVEFYRGGSLVGVFDQNQPFDRHRLWGRNFLPIHAVLFERSLLALGCRFDESLEVYEDWDFWTQLSQHTDFVHVDRVTCCYRNAGQSGFGEQPSEEVVSRGKIRYYEKWRTRWSGQQLKEIVDSRETVIDGQAQRLQQLQHDTEQRQRDAEQRIQCLSGELSQLQQRWTELDTQFSSLRAQYRQREADIEGLQHDLATQRAQTLAAQEQSTRLDGLLARSRMEAGLLDRDLQLSRHELQSVYASRSWRLTAPYRSAGNLLRRLKTARRLAGAYIADRGAIGGLRLVGTATRLLLTQGPSGIVNAARAYADRRRHPVVPAAALDLAPVVGHPIVPHAQPVDVIVCVHNALDDVKACLASVLRHTAQPYRLILVDDGSEAPTRDFLSAFAAEHGATLARNEAASGYTLAANQGMRLASAPYLVLLNSDTIVSEGWLDRLVVCAESDPVIGIVGPLSNTASWQSIPSLMQDGDWSDNPLPQGMNVDDMARIVARSSGQTYPRLGFLNGFCLLIKRAVIERLGLFDEQTFGKGYGEENDFCLRTTGAGFTLAVADDVYVFHAQSRSYSTERRRVLARAADVALAQKHGQPPIDAGVHLCRFDRAIEGIRVHASMLFERHALTERARARFAGKRVIFVLPVQEAGGGANVVVNEARAMRRMGVDAQLLNFSGSRAAFEAGYPGLDIPVVYADNEAAIPERCAGFDAVVATLNLSVSWIAPLQASPRPPVLGYYIQDFEPSFYRSGSPEYLQALQSYGAVPGMVCVTKTRWNADLVQHQAGRACTVIGPSYDVDLFVPRRRSRAAWPQAPLRVVAMIRPSTPRRSPRLTMQVLQAIANEFQDQVEILLFGVDPSTPEFLALPHDFAWTSAGVLSPERMALLLNEADVFVDFSQYQAMGLTALEAMACGVAAVVPTAGGCDSFAVHERNALYVDTNDAEACLQAVRRLLQDHALRQSLQRQGLVDVAAHVPERPAVRMLEALFGGPAVSASAVGDVVAMAGPAAEPAPSKPALEEQPEPRAVPARPPSTPLQVFHTPARGRRRITVVLDAMDGGARTDSVNTAILLGALLAERCGTDLRLVTRAAPPQPLMLHPLLQATGLKIAGDLQCRHLPVTNPQAELDLLEGERLITEAWWNAAAALAAVGPARVVHLLLRDDRLTDGDDEDRRRCDDLLRRADLLHVVGSETLRQQLVDAGFEHFATSPFVLPTAPWRDAPAALEPVLAALSTRA